MLKLYNAEHSLGGIAGYEVKETTDENPERVSLVQYVTWTYLRSLLDIEHDSWKHAQSVLDDKMQWESFNLKCIKIKTAHSKNCFIKIKNGNVYSSK